MPCSLEIGEGSDFLFNTDADFFVGDKWTHIGVRDSFGRIHWAPKKQLSEARKAFHDKPKEST